VIDPRKKTVIKGKTLGQDSTINKKGEELELRKRGKKKTKAQRHSLSRGRGGVSRWGKGKSMVQEKGRQNRLRREAESKRNFSQLNGLVTVDQNLARRSKKKSKDSLSGRLRHGRGEVGEKIQDPKKKRRVFNGG